MLASRTVAMSVVLLLALIACPTTLACAANSHAHAKQNASAAPDVHGAAEQTEVLDRVVAVVDEHAILASDVDEEMRFTALQSTAKTPADNTPQQALGRVIDRTLIDEQRALQPGLAEISQKDVDRSIADLRNSIPACAKDKCKADAAWQAVLTAHGFTQAEIEQRIRERLAILRFIDLRFSVAVRVPNAAVQKYYDEVLKPKLQANKATVPDVRTVAPRIREILREQQVDTMVDQWVKGLHTEEHVRVLDAAYGDRGGGQ